MVASLIKRGETGVREMLGLNFLTNKANANAVLKGIIHKGTIHLLIECYVD